MVYKEIKKRKKVLSGVTSLEHTGCGKMHTTINYDEGCIYEVFCKLGKTGQCVNSWAEFTGRLITLCLRAGVDPHEIIKQGQGIRCPSPYVVDAEAREVTTSCADAIAKTIKNEIERMAEQVKPEVKPVEKVK